MADFNDDSDFDDDIDDDGPAAAPAALEPDADGNLEVAIAPDTEPGGRRRAKADRAMRFARENQEKVRALEAELTSFKREAGNFADSIDRNQPEAEDPEAALVQAQDDNLTWFNSLSAEEQAKPEVLERAKKNARDAERAIQEHRANRVYDARRAQDQQQSQAQQVYNDVAAAYPEIVKDPRMFRWADGEHSKLLAEGGTPGRDLQLQAAEAARRHFKTGANAPGPTPSPSRRDAYGGSPRGATAGSAPSTSIRMDKGMRSIARAAYPHLDPDAAVRHWAKENGAAYNKMKNG